MTSSAFSRPREGGVYQTYFLLHNPFPSGAALLTLHNLRGFKQANRVFVREVRQTELVNLHAFLADSLESDTPRHLWLTGSKGAGKTAVIVQAICELEELHRGQIAPIYLGMPPTGEEILRGVFSAAVELIDGEQLRECAGRLLARELATLLDGAPPAEWRGADLPGLHQELSEKGGAVLQRILFENVTPYRVEKEKLRRALMLLARRQNLGELAEKALETALSKGFEDGALAIRHGRNNSSDVIGLLKILGLRYSRAALFIDQLDTVWPRMNLRDRELFFGALSEIIRLAGSLLNVVIVADPVIKEDLRLPSLEEARRVLPTSERNILEVPEFRHPEHIGKILMAYLDSDLGRQEAVDSMEARGFDPLYPFTDAAVEQLLRSSQGNVSRALVAANGLIEFGRENGFPVFSPEHVKQIFS